MDRNMQKYFLIILLISTKVLCDPPKGCVEFFEHTNYNGSSKVYCDNEDLSDLPEDNYFSSLKVGPNTSLKVFKGEDFEGDSKVFTGNVKNLVPLGFNDKITSFKIKEICDLPKGCVDFFKHNDFKGKVTRFCDDKKELKPSINDSFSSFKLGPKTELIIYEHSFFKGKKMIFIEENAKLADLGFNDVTSSFKINKRFSRKKIHYLIKENVKLKHMNSHFLDEIHLLQTKLDRLKNPHSHHIYSHPYHHLGHHGHHDSHYHVHSPHHGHHHGITYAY